MASLLISAGEIFDVPGGDVENNPSMIRSWDTTVPSRSRTGHHRRGGWLPDGVVTGTVPGRGTEVVSLKSTAATTGPVLADVPEKTSARAPPVVRCGCTARPASGEPPSAP